MRSRILLTSLLMALFVLMSGCGGCPNCPVCGTTQNGTYGVIDIVAVPEHNPTGEPGGPFNSFDISSLAPNPAASGTLPGLCFRPHWFSGRGGRYVYKHCGERHSGIQCRDRCGERCESLRSQHSSDDRRIWKLHPVRVQESSISPGFRVRRQWQLRRISGRPVLRCPRQWCKSHVRARRQRDHARREIPLCGER